MGKQCYALIKKSNYKVKLKPLTPKERRKQKEQKKQKDDITPVVQKLKVFQVVSQKKKQQLKNLGIRSFSFRLNDNRYKTWLGGAVDIVVGMLSRVRQNNQVHEGIKIGLNINIDAPHTSLNYAKLSTDRRVPFRNFFGVTKNEKELTRDEKKTLEGCVNKEMKLTKKAKFVYRASYNVGACVSSDVRTTLTRDMPKKLKILCDALSSALGGKFPGVEKFAFNHVSILFYATDYDLAHNNRRESILDWHADHLKGKDNIPKKSKTSNYSQKPKTPTVVLSLGDDKKYVYGIRFVGDDGNWSDTTEVESEILKHGVFHFLHPDDEDVKKRVISVQNKLFRDHKRQKSQFMHMVHCKSTRESPKKISVSLVFRDVGYEVYYSSTNTLIDSKTSKLVQNKSTGTEVSNRRIVDISDARKKINKELRADVSSNLANMADRLVKIHHTTCNQTNKIKKYK